MKVARLAVWLVRYGTTYPMQIDTVWTTEADARARAAGKGPHWHVMKYWSVPPDAQDTSLPPRTTEEAGLCCLMAHAHAVAPWTCACSCHTRPQEPRVRDIWADPAQDLDTAVLRGVLDIYPPPGLPSAPPRWSDILELAFHYPVARQAVELVEGGYATREEALILAVYALAGAFQQLFAQEVERRRNEPPTRWNQGRTE